MIRNLTVPVSKSSLRKRSSPWRRETRIYSDTTWRRFLVYFARLGLGGILLYAGVVKLFEQQAFSVAIANYDLLPKSIIPFFAMTIPCVEMLTGLSLLFDIGVMVSAWVSLFLFATFGAAVTSALIRGLDIGCGCFDTEEGAAIGIHTLAIEAACMGASLLVILSARKAGWIADLRQRFHLKTN